MERASPLLKAMIEECRSVLSEWKEPARDLPKALQPEHLERMCDRIDQHVEDWPTTRLHRWIGFIQSAMVANRMLDLDGLKRMFDKAKNAYGAAGDDLTDHLDPQDYFELDIGGEG